MYYTEAYLKKFRESTLNRCKIFRELAIKKSVLDKNVISGRVLTEQEILQLQNIIGKDTLLRKAEGKHQQTLRHITWKILQSINKFDSAFKYFMKKDSTTRELLAWKEILEMHISRIKEPLQELDFIYKREQSTLLHSEPLIEHYRGLLLEEKTLLKNLGKSVAEINKNSGEFLIIAKQFLRACKAGKIKNSGGLGITIFFVTTTFIYLLSIGALLNAEIPVRELEFGITTENIIELLQLILFLLSTLSLTLTWEQIESKLKPFLDFYVEVKSF